jgi:hypothetical protein
MKALYCVVLCASSLCLIPLLASTLPAETVIIDFESLEQANADLNCIVTPSYQENGFAITAPNAASTICSWGTSSGSFSGSTGLTFNAVDGHYFLTHNNGEPFDLLSIDIDDNFGGPVTVDYTGTKSGGGSVTQSFTTDVVDGFETFTFTGFSGLTSVDWFQSFPFHQIDNVALNVVPEPGDFNGDLIVDGADFLKWQREDGSPASLLEWEASYGNDYALAAASAAVPEPSTLLLASLTGVLVGSRRRRVSVRRCAHPR